MSTAGEHASVTEDAGAAEASDIAEVSDITEATLGELVVRARSLIEGGKRSILGITGVPGAGKSTLAARLVNELGAEVAVLVPMDGYHLAEEVLTTLGSRERKGAHDTFDAGGYVSLMQRIERQSRADGEPIVYAPRFRRDLEEPVGSSIPVRRDVPLVITEGNYLLLREFPWTTVRELLDEVWFVAPTEDQRLRQLIARHVEFGRTPEEARERSLGSDQRNAELIAQTAADADLIVRVL